MKEVGLIWHQQCYIKTCINLDFNMFKLVLHTKVALQLKTLHPHFCLICQFHRAEFLDLIRVSWTEQTERRKTRIWESDFVERNCWINLAGIFMIVYYRTYRYVIERLFIPNICIFCIFFVVRTPWIHKEPSISLFFFLI